MAKRTSVYDDSELEQETPPVIRLRLLRDVRLKITGKATGREYYFPGAGSELDVDEKDAEIMLNTPTPVSCCGSVGSPKFEIVR